ncbi:MAG: glycosyltransferase family 4 protein [Cyanomargarita calcarea GSE-NOS-MK-12-04C]|jgi:glycosyltransferase involved in cell wall biosynthesis|uniref:Glycosyltransferase family 4 protein n=1 Tax=Cyanomargarita calcarea GSE-NOS-MK-12-04C TaxID=2839659 RepID=A0A951QHV9_9CYAN|nr:glycosyltransferase family 4 protein [Cyanomargarita calcarea GSE-NOS-MK-12-04C]
MIKIAYDYQVFSWAKYGGISRYIYEIATQIANTPSFEVKIFAGFYVNKYLDNCAPNLVKGWQIPLIPKSAKLVGAIDAELSKIWLHQDTPDIVHETYYSRNRIAPKRSKTVVTVYDMLHEKFGHTMKKKDRDFSVIKANSIKRADHIICISENTKKDLLELLDIEPKKISTIHLGYFLQNDLFKDDNRPIEDPYILYVGERKLEYKNFKRLIQAYATRPSLKDNFKLVCFGSRPFSTTETAMIDNFGINHSQIIYVSGEDKILANFYTHASVFVYPSLYEGFGLPLLEAMSFRCPVVCSNTSSIPEVVADAGEYFNPYEVDSISDALERVLFSTERTRELIDRGKERVKYFSWDKCAKQTQLVYKSLL